jgi:hypothetical protein
VAKAKRKSLNPDKAQRPKAVIKSVGGRGNVAVTLNETVKRGLMGAGQIHATIPEVAAFLQISVEALYNFWEREPEARRIYDEAKEMGRLTFRRKQLALAEKNGAVCIFMGKQILGQKDDPTPPPPPPPAQQVNIQVNVNDPRERIMGRLSSLLEHKK